MEKTALRAQAQGDPVGALIQSLEANDWRTTTSCASAALPLGELTLTDNMPKGEYDPTARTVVVVDKENHKTHVLQVDNCKVEEVLSITNSVGKPGRPTPEGRKEVSDKRLDPVWTPPKSVDPQQRPVAPFSVNPSNPIGKAFIRLDGGPIGLHGTNRPDQLGKHVSLGCVRHHNDDVLKLYPMVERGTAVYIVPRFSGARVRTEDFFRKP